MITNAIPKFFFSLLGASSIGYAYKKGFLHLKKPNEECFQTPYLAFFFKTFPSTPLDHLFYKIESNFKNSSNQQFSFDLTDHILELRKFLREKSSGNQNNNEQAELIGIKIKTFLSKQRSSEIVENLISFVFYKIHPASKIYPEYDYEKLLLLKELFSLMNDCITEIEDKNLVQEIKILFANLPLENIRENFPNLFLSKTEQVWILTEHLQRQEDLLIKDLIRRLQKKTSFLTAEEVKGIEKLLSSEKKNNSFSLPSELSGQNKKKLEESFHAYQKEMRHSLISKITENIPSLKEETSFFLPENPVKIIQRISKCKFFFEQQLMLSENEIQIPYWYHATKESGIKQILMAHEIKVSKKELMEQGYNGAWVSSTPESEIFGKYIVALSSKIENIHPKDVRPSLLFSTRRWRGLLNPISIVEHAIIFSVPHEKDKEQQKKKKLEITDLLSPIPSSYPYKVVSEKQLCFMQREINSVLGHPNLPPHFWKY